MAQTGSRHVDLTHPNYGTTGRFKLPVSGSKITIIPVKCRKKELGERFDLGSAIINELRRNNLSLKSGDLLVVSSKFAALAEGRFVKLDEVVVGESARKLSKTYDLNPGLAQKIMDESEVILGGIPGFVLAVSKGVLAANAGIDRSNVPSGYAILYPENPRMVAAKLRRDLLVTMKRNSRSNRKGANLGIIISDSRVTPARIGTIGVAVAVSGFDAVEDLRGKRDLFGNELKVTIRALADQLASAAEFVMGESSEEVPIALIRGADVRFNDDDGVDNMSIDQKKCLIIEGLRNPFTP